MRKSCLAAFSICFLVLFLLGCPSETPEGGVATEGKRIVILTNGDDPFWDACEAGAFKAEEELGLESQGVSVTFERADFTVKGQVDKLKQYSVQNDIVAVGISVFDPEARVIAEELKKLRAKGVKVITIDGDINNQKYRDARFAYIGTDNFVGGRELGRAGKALASEGGKYVQFVGSKSAFNAIQRMDGFKEGAGDKLIEVERLDDGADRPKARENVVDALNRDSDVNVLVGIWAYNTPQIVAVVKDRNIRDKTTVCCFDAAESSITEMADGNVDVMVVQNPYQMGFDGVKLLKAMLDENQTVIDEMYPEYSQEGDKDVFRTELRVVVPDGDTPVKKELFEANTVYMTLSEFQKWLEERGLSSS